LRLAAGLYAVVILGLDPRIHAVPDVEGAADRNSASLQRSNVTAWIPGSARVASLLASPWNDEGTSASANLQPRRYGTEAKRPIEVTP
jgi:hypothetical protein